MKESPLFARTHDLLLWLATATRKFPREQRFGLAQRVMDYGFALQDALTAAALDPADRAHHLLQADLALNGLHKVLRLCHDLKLLSDGQYRHVSEMAVEVGRLLGAWRRQPDAGGPA